MNWVFNGLPLHPLLVHFVVVLVPLAAICLAVGTVWPAARRRLGIVTPILGLVALICTAIAQEAGEVFEEQVKETALTEAHTEQGDNLIGWAVGLFAVGLVQWLWFHYFAESGRFASRLPNRVVRLAIAIVLAVLAVIVVVGSLVEIVVIGESGARAVWS